MNTWSGIGRLARDPEVKNLQSGTQITSFTIAVRTRDKDKPLWLNVICFSKTGEIAQKYLSKGSQCGVAGRLQIREWEKQDGGKGMAVEIVANEIHLIGSPSQNNSVNQTPNTDENW